MHNVVALTFWLGLLSGAVGTGGDGAPPKQSGSRRSVNIEGAYVTTRRDSVQVPTWDLPVGSALRRFERRGLATSASVHDVEGITAREESGALAGRPVPSLQDAAHALAHLRPVSVRLQAFSRMGHQFADDIGRGRVACVIGETRVASRP